MTPQVGQYLFASCSAEDYGRVVAVGQDANGASTIDIEVLQPDDLVDCSDDSDVGTNPLTTLEVPEGVKLVLRHVQYRAVEDRYIICNTPGNNCFRCTKLFKLRDFTAQDWLSGKVADDT